jgi:nucleoside-diphosphate-sugar epimerase
MNESSSCHSAFPTPRATTSSPVALDRRDERLLVTGSSGYLGRYVTAQLRAGGRSFVELNSPEQTERVDLREAAAVRRFLTATRPRTILHLAGFTGRAVAEGKQSPGRGAAALDDRRYDEVNVEGTRNLLSVAGELGVERVVSIGSAAEYGVRATAEPVDVWYDGQPTTLYGRSKRRQTAVVGELAERWGFSACVLRVFNLFGPEQPPGLVIPDLLARLEAERGGVAEPLTLTGAQDVRDFVPVELVARVIVALADRPAVVGVQHACSGEGVAILQVANWLAAEYDRGEVWRVSEVERGPTFSVGVPSPILRELAVFKPTMGEGDLPLSWPLPLERLIRRVARLAWRSAAERG